MSDKLTEICEVKRGHIAERKQETSTAELEARCAQAEPPRGFAAALKAKSASGGYALIAEIKKASPSKGLIRADFDPPALADGYRRGGAACLSVLTDGPYFQGDDGYLAAARAAAPLPALRKDFMLDPYQILESRALGADCVLLIMAALEDGQAAELEDCARGLGMDVLIEVHNGDELDRALRPKSELIGVNNRNLKTLTVDLATTESLRERIPADRVAVSESGLFTREDLARMAAIDVRCFLIGESLMRQDDVAAATADLLGGDALPLARSA